MAATAILDYSSLSEIRAFRPLINVDPRDVDPLAGEDRTCACCSGPLTEVEEVSETAWGDPAAILACPACGWWCQYAIGSNRDGYYEAERVPAALRTYSVADIEVPLDALRRELSRRSGILEELCAKRMEELVGSVLSDFMDCEVIHTGRTGDGGIDLLLLNSDLQYVVQVKRRIVHNRGESVRAIREFLGATLLAGAKRGIYVTTATHFTPAAAEAAASARSLGLVEKLHLVDRTRFFRLLNLVSDHTLPPWRAFYRDAEGSALGDPIHVRFLGEHSPCDWVRDD